LKLFFPARPNLDGAAFFVRITAAFSFSAHTLQKTMSERDQSPKRTKKTYLDEIILSAQKAMCREPDNFIFAAPREKPRLNKLLMKVEKLPNVNRIVKLYACAVLNLFWSDVTSVIGAENLNGTDGVGFRTEDGVIYVGERFFRHQGYTLRDSTPKEHVFDELRAFLVGVEQHRLGKFKNIIWPLDSFTE